MLQKVLSKLQDQHKVLDELEAVSEELKVAEAELATARCRLFSLTAQIGKIGDKYYSTVTKTEHISCNK